MPFATIGGIALYHEIHGPPPEQIVRWMPQEVDHASDE